MRRLSFLGLAAAAVMLVGAAPVSAKRDDPNKDSRTILVKFVPNIDAKGSIDDEGDVSGGELKTKVRLVKVKKDSSVDDAIARYSARDDVEYAEANYVASADSPPLKTPSDPSYGSQWALAQIHAFDGWSTYPGAYGTPDGTVIAVADTGIDSTHPDLSGQVDTADGAVCLSGTCSSDAALDDNGHGTHVAGIAAASTDNGVGIAGEAVSSSVMPVKVLDSNGSGTYASIASGIIWAADHGAEVINLSLSGAAYSKTLCDAVSYATSHGAVVVAAAGNDSTSIQEYPAACPGAIGVGATDSNDSLASFSDYGYPDVFVTAPGVSILSTFSGGGYATLSGTSMAAPFVSGLAALLRGENTARTVADVKRIIAATADKVGSSSYGGDQFNVCGGGCSWNSSFGYGRVNVASALAFVPTPDFAFSSSAPSATARQGASASFPVSADALDGYSGVVSLSVSGLPGGATASFDSSSIGVPGNATLTVNASSPTPIGTYPLAISATDGTLTHTTNVTLTVAASDFTVSVAPTSGSVARGKSVALAVSTSALGSFGGTVSLSATGLGSGETASFSSSSIGAPGTSTLTITAGSSATLGTFNVTIKGTSGSVVHTATLALNVVVADFSVSSTPASVTVLQGDTASYAVSVAALNGFTGNITMSASGYPTGATVAFSPGVVAVPGSSLLTVKTGATTPVGTYTLTIKGTSSARVVRSATVKLVVNPVGDFSFSVNPSSLTVPRGSRGTTYVSLTGQNGFYCTVGLSSSGLPAGVSATWGATSKLVSGTTTSSVSLKLSASSSVAPGTYSIQLAGTCGSIVHSATVTLTVN